MDTVTPFLWYDTQALEAAEHYVSVFSSRPGADPDGSRILDVARQGEAGPGEAGPVFMVTFELEGQRLMALNGGSHHTFNESFSLFVRCQTQEEVDHLWDSLTSGGGDESMCGWLKDRYGLSWQIVPSALMELMGDPDPAKAQAVTQAMLQMRKIEIDGLRRAYEAA